MAKSVLIGVDPQLIKAARKAPFLGRDEEHDLAVAWKERGDRSALKTLTESHIRLVIKLAAGFRHYGLSVSDLAQEGHVGLLEAAARFEPERGVRFSTYATWWIRASIQDYVLRNWSIVRGGTSSQQKQLFFSVRRLRAKLQQDPNMSTGEAFQRIARIVGVSLRDVEAMEARLAGSDLSLDGRLIDDDGNSGERMDFLVDDRPLPDETAERRIDSERHNRWVGEALKRLNPRERRILQQRDMSDEPASLAILGEELGVSRERVRQIEMRALQKLRRAIQRSA